MLNTLHRSHRTLSHEASSKRVKAASSYQGVSGYQAAFRSRPAELDTRLAWGESSPKERQGCGRVVAGAQPLLVRGACGRGEAGLRTHRRPARGGRARARLERLRQHRDGADGVLWRIGFRESRCSGRRWWERCTRALRRQSQWAHHLRRGAPARHCARASLACGVPLHARRGRGRRGVRVRTWRLPAFRQATGAAKDYKSWKCRRNISHLR